MDDAIVVDSTRATVTASGRIDYDRGEVEVYVAREVKTIDIETTTTTTMRTTRTGDATENILNTMTTNHRMRDENGETTMMVAVTSARVVITVRRRDATIAEAFGIPYEAVTCVERMKKKHTLSTTRRVRVVTEAKRTRATSASGTSVTVDAAPRDDSAQIAFVTYEFAIKGSVGDTFTRALEDQWRQHKEYERRSAAAAIEATATTSATAATAGIAGILNRQRERSEETNRTLDEAFTDLSALMSKARELVVLAERLAECSGTSRAENSELQRLVLSLGITNPVTHATSGAEFHMELSRQLSDWLVPVLAKHDGIITLTDAFCLFNRARGIELVSPRDMLAACGSWTALGIDLHLRRFDSGVIVIHTKDRSDECACAKLQAALGTSLSLSLDSYEASQVLRTTPEIALEYLRVAESKGLLCRDDGPTQTRFYANCLNEF